MKTITVTLSGGAVIVKTTGYAGAECLKATAQLEADLGLEKSSDERTPEFYQQQAVQATVKVGQ